MDRIEYIINKLRKTRHEEMLEEHLCKHHRKQYEQAKRRVLAMDKHSPDMHSIIAAVLEGIQFQETDYIWDAVYMLASKHTWQCADIYMAQDSRDDHISKPNTTD